MNKKVMVVAFLKPTPHEFEFTKWPNHITIVPYFNVSKQDKLIEKIKEICSGIKPIPYEIGSVDYYGKNKNLKVNKVKDSTPLTKLHTGVLKIALTHDSNINTVFCHPNYAPHITHNNKPYPKKGNKGIIKSISIVEDLSANTKNKKVLSIISLAG